MERHTKCACDNIPGNCIPCFEIRLCLNSRWHSICISQTTKQEGKAKNKITKNKGNMPLFFCLEKSFNPSLWFTLVCLIEQTKSVPNESKGNTSSDSTGPRKVWQSGSVLQDKTTALQEKQPYLTLSSLQRDQAIQGAYRCKYFCNWSWKWNTNKSSKRISISPQHHRDRKEQVHNQDITWALFVSLGRSKLPVFPLNILVFVLTGSLVSRYSFTG